VKKVIVRAPESGDEAIRKEASTTSSDDDKPAPAPNKAQTQTTTSSPKSIEKPKQTTPQRNFVEDNFNDDGDNEVSDDVPEDTPIAPKRKGADFYHSDGVNMIMELFDGKIIE
jgi:hypothetical protein